MSNGRSETYQLEGFETVAGDQTLRNQYSIIPENMRDEIENREVWNSIGDVGEGLGNIITGTAEGFGYDLSDPSSLLTDLALSMFLPPTLKNVVKGTKKTKGLNPYQKTELAKKAPLHPYRPTLPVKQTGINVHDSKVIRDFHKKNPYFRGEVNPYDVIEHYRGTFPNQISKAVAQPSVPMQKATTAIKSNNTKKLLPLLLAMGNQTSNSKNVAERKNILDSLIMDIEPMELRKPNFEEQVLNMLKEDSKWRY